MDIAAASQFHFEIKVHRIVISPQGTLGLVAFTGLDAEVPVPAELLHAFEESIAAGLMLLAGQKHAEVVPNLPPEFLFWRGRSKGTGDDLRGRRSF